MENIEKMIDETTGVTEIIEVTTDKLSFKENIMAYSIAGIFVTGLVTVGYLGYKGTKKLANKIRDKKQSKVDIEDTVIEVEFKENNDDSNEDNSEE